MISPIVLQGAIQRTQDVSQIKQNEDTRPQAEHISITTRQQEKEIKKHEQVTKQENADKHQNKYDAKEKGNGSYFGNSEKRNKKEKEEDGKAIVRQSASFDVKA